MSNIKVKHKNQSQILFTKIKTPFGVWPLRGTGSVGGTHTRPYGNQRTSPSPLARYRRLPCLRYTCDKNPTACPRSLHDTGGQVRRLSARMPRRWLARLHSRSQSCPSTRSASNRAYIPARAPRVRALRLSAPAHMRPLLQRIILCVCPACLRVCCTASLVSPSGTPSAPALSRLHCTAPQYRLQENFFYYLVENSNLKYKNLLPSKKFLNIKKDL